MTGTHIRNIFFAVVFAVGITPLLGCDEAPTPTGGESSSQDIQDGAAYTIGDEIAMLGLEEGDEITYEIEEMVGVDAMAPLIKRQATYRLENGELVPVGDAPPLPASDAPILPLGVHFEEDETIASGGQDQCASTQQTDGDTGPYPSNINSQLEEMVPMAMEKNPFAVAIDASDNTPGRVRSMVVDKSQRLDTTVFIDDLYQSGITVQMRPENPMRIGASEVVALYLDSNTRAAIEQFEDETALVEWYRVNQQLYTDQGLDPEKHMVVRGMTIVRFGPSGHPAALDLTRQMRMTDIAIQ